MQDGVKGALPAYRGTLHAATCMIRDEGFLSLYSGALGIELCAVCEGHGVGSTIGLHEIYWDPLDNLTTAPREQNRCPLLFSERFSAFTFS